MFVVHRVPAVEACNGKPLFYGLSSFVFEFPLLIDTKITPNSISTASTLRRLSTARP
jgi:hypothetical protein